ncbi:Hypothetical protein GSB_150609 [Giardia duodenalis]|uniref:Uncharacterized protein n=2 Tax=Giardia intestinalis TaxID=5741 RepID=C6LS30_GIAIB|nr:Hypothetical protein GL50581_1566 [Giardia intestinalis ATCC 50581]ESU42643.1 Hypothetical protein GSB_150609 [Giardia intestinalis]
MSKFLTVKCMSSQPPEASLAHRDYIYRPQSPVRRPHTHSSNLNAHGRRTESRAFAASTTTPTSEMEQPGNMETMGLNRTLLKSLVREVLDEMGINSFIEAQETRYLETQRQLRQLTQTLAKVRDVLEANSDDILSLQEQIEDARQALELFKDETKGTMDSLAKEVGSKEANRDTPCLLAIQKELADIRFELSTIKTVSKFF